MAGCNSAGDRACRMSLLHVFAIISLTQRSSHSFVVGRRCRSQFNEAKGFCLKRTWQIDVEINLHVLFCTSSLIPQTVACSASHQRRGEVRYACVRYECTCNLPHASNSVSAQIGAVEHGAIDE